MTASIRTPDQRLRVFVSSTLQELADERAASKEAIQRLRLTPVMFELGARAHPPRELYRAYLAQSDVFIGLYWQRYGWVAPNETVSGLEDEYLLSKAMPKLIYIKRAETREDRLKELIHRIQAEDQVSYRPFSDAAELTELIEDDLALMLTERFSATGAAPPTLPALTLAAPPLSQAPVERGELIGRAPQVAQVTELLQRTDTGLVTLTGPGGTGKTRLAIHLANTAGPAFGDGVFFVPLAGVRSPRDVVPTIVSTLEIPVPVAGADPQKILFGFLHARHALLCLDNFEQVLAAAGEVQKLLETCPHVKVLVTSREPLRLRGEHEVPVPPLPHDFGASQGITPAMALFELRAREVRPDFAIDDSNRAAVVELCRRLDALPLAIELAAARVRVLSPQAMLPRLNQSLALLTSGQRDLPERQQTLRATIEWSLDLLRPEERVFFRRLGIFVGSFSEAAAAAVADASEIDVLDGLTSLVEKNLLVRSEVRGDARFHLLETVRQLAQEHVAAAGEERAARLSQAEWAARFLTAEQTKLIGADIRQAAIERVGAEESGLRQALQFAASAEGDPELAWQLFIQFAFALESGAARTTEVLAAYERLQPLPRSADPLRAALALGVWSYARASMSDPAAASDLEAVCAVLEAANEQNFLPTLMTSWGNLLAPIDPPRGLAILARALQLARDTRQTIIEGWVLMAIGYGHLQSGALDEAQRRADELIALARHWHNDEEGLALALTLEARVKLVRGDLASARSLFAEAVALARTRDLAWPRAMALCGLASVTLAAGDETGARPIIEEALFFGRGVGYVSIGALCGALACLLAKSGDRDRARRVFSATSAGTENETDHGATMADPSGALRAATREARALLDNPPPLDPAAVDLDAVIQAAIAER